MHAVRQRFRPKHQVLVLKCYPKFQKNVQQVKPNSSELSYLLYYATTRRSKLQKVGLFLEKKTASDVWRLKFGNVQVTLQVLTALMEKAPRDLPLYASSVLTILETVLNSKDVNMVEESLPTFEAYCRYQNASSLASDQHRSQQYHEVVRVYASFANKDFASSFKITLSPPVAIRWKTAGLRALRSVVGAEAFGSDGTRLLTIVLPVILENLYIGNDDALASLHEKAQTGEKTDVQNARRRRMSIATVNTVDTVEASPAAASETTADADKVAEDEVRVLAARCLKQIYAAGTGSNRGQVRLATMLTLNFITDRDPPSLGSKGTTSRAGTRSNWATMLVETVARWTPVQDRFIIVITAVDALISSAVEESKLKQQLTLATMIDWLLSSSINLIGLSVMDVLLGFVQHILLLLQLGGRGSKITPHKQQADALEDEAPGRAEKIPGQSHVNNVTNVTTPSSLRQELLLHLQQCIGNLATHIYYTDQISDMLAAILARLKPSANSELSSPAAAIENPVATANAIANSASLQEDPLTDGFFSFATARATALRAVKNILLVANTRKSLTGAAAEARSRVGVQVWEGTQWLLRDEDRDVRIAYVDALLTWLKLETNKNDLLVPKEGSRKAKPNSKKGHNENGESKLAKRVVSNASRKENKTVKTTFLQLLHLAIYDNAIETPQMDSDILLLHLLLTNLTERLGVNAVRHGLPMMLRLQDDLGSLDTLKDAKARINADSLVYGYLWALSEKFDFETGRTGGEIHAEISRRMKNGLWLDKIRLPAIPLDHIVTPPSSPAEKGVLTAKMSNESTRPWKSRAALVEEMCTSYNESLMTPANSPPTSPGRVFSVPALNFGYGYSMTPGPKPSPEDQLPQKVKDELLAEWSKDSVIAAVEKERSDSLSGSKTGTGSVRAGRNFLTVDATNGVGRSASLGDNDSPTRAGVDAGGHRTSSMAYALNGGLGNLQKLQRTGTDEGSPTPLTASSSRDSTVRVTELKRVLSGYHNPSIRHASPLRSPVPGVGEANADSVRSGTSSESESMVSYSEAEGGTNDSAPDLNVVEQADFASTPPAEGKQRKSSQMNPERPNSASSGRVDNSVSVHTTTTTTTTNANPTLPSLKSDPRLGHDVPPVPHIPSSLNLPGSFPCDVSPRRPSSSQGAERQSHHHRHHHQHQHDHGSYQDPSLLVRPSTAPGRHNALTLHRGPMGEERDALSPTSTALGSPREGRSLRRGKLFGSEGRSGSGRTAQSQSHPLWQDTTTAKTTTTTTRSSGRADLARLLERIEVDDDDDEERDSTSAGAYYIASDHRPGSGGGKAKANVGEGMAGLVAVKPPPY